LLAVERDHGQRVGSYAVLTQNRLLLADSLLARGNAALVDSLTRYAVAPEGSAIVNFAVIGVAPALMLLRARALEMLGKRDDALVIARGMQAIVKPDTPPAKALQAAYREMAQRLGASADAKSGIAVPAKR
jgi:hypothetical protein